MWLSELPAGAVTMLATLNKAPSPHRGQFHIQTRQKNISKGQRYRNLKCLLQIPFFLNLVKHSLIPDEILLQCGVVFFFTCLLLYPSSPCQSVLLNHNGEIPLVALFKCVSLKYTCLQWNEWCISRHISTWNKQQNSRFSFLSIAADTYLKLNLRVIIHKRQPWNVFHMLASESLYYVTTPGWCQLSKYCMLFTLKDVPCILTYTPGSFAYQPFRELCLLKGSSSPPPPPSSCITFWNAQ